MDTWLRFGAGQIAPARGVGARLRRMALLGLTSTLSFAQLPPSYTLRTVAGNGSSGFTGDGSQAVSAQLSNPFGIAVDRSGVMYVADQVNNRIRRVTAEGTISTVAGDGTGAFKGDGSAATSAGINRPVAVAIDGSGNLLIADLGNALVRKVTSGGTISTVAGEVGRLTVNDGGKAIEAKLVKPASVAWDSAGNFYVADTADFRIRKIGTDGIISTYAGNGVSGYLGDGGAATAARLNQPQGIAIDGGNNLYIADSGNHAIRKVTPAGVITTVAGTGTPGFAGDGGPATKASLFFPRGVSVDAAGNLFIADTYNNRIRVVAAAGTITTIAGTGSFGDAGDGGQGTAALLRFPSDVKVDGGGNVFFVDNQNHRVRRLTPSQDPVLPTTLPSIQSGGVMTSSNYGGFPSIAPGAWIEIYGTNLAARARTWSAGDFEGSTAPTALDSTSVSIGGQAAYLAYVSPGQITAQVASNVGTGPQQMTVSTAAGTSARYAIQVNAQQPGLSAPPALKIGDRQYVLAQFSDGAYVLPEGALPGVPSRPARAGDTIVLYGNGFGGVTPTLDAGQIVPQPNSLTVPVQFLFGQTIADPAYAGLAVGSVGLYQFNVVVPNGTATGDVPFTFLQGGIRGTQRLVIALRN